MKQRVKLNGIENVKMKYKLVPIRKHIAKFYSWQFKADSLGGANGTGVYFLNFIGDSNIQLGFGTSELEEEILN